MKWGVTHPTPPQETKKNQFNKKTNFIQKKQYIQKRLRTGGRLSEVDMWGVGITPFS